MKLLSIALISHNNFSKANIKLTIEITGVNLITVLHKLIDFIIFL